MSKDQILKSLRAMIVDGGFKADAIIVDGFDFSRADYGSISNVKAFAKELGLSVWYSCSIGDQGRQLDEHNFPLALTDCAELIDVVIVLEPKQDHIELSVSKDRDTPDTKALAMRLDPRTMLILEG